MFTIVSLTPDHAEPQGSQLAELLIDAVDSGASIGFMPPLAESEAREYWQGVLSGMREGSRVLLVAVEGGMVQGSVQIALEMRANGNHRGELMKLFVHRRARRQGIAKALMSAAEAKALELGRTLLVMDTRKGGDAEKMCEALGYIRYGEVPRYARSSDGTLHTTVFFYRAL
ncbi:MAG TPA: GNAT family N-acetyltransferase [Bryobacteraceae bacterium]|nr:GNAT family N-acetyltransferase [Bryobacteraceae bacterium]